MEALHSAAQSLDLEFKEKTTSRGQRMILDFSEFLRIARQRNP